MNVNKTFFSCNGLDFFFLLLKIEAREREKQIVERQPWKKGMSNFGNDWRVSVTVVLVNLSRCAVRTRIPYQFDGVLWWMQNYSVNGPMDTGIFMVYLTLDGFTTDASCGIHVPANTPFIYRYYGRLHFLQYFFPLCIGVVLLLFFCRTENTKFWSTKCKRCTCAAHLLCLKAMV